MASISWILSVSRFTNFFFLTGGDAAPTDEITADGQNGVSFIHPMGEIFLQPLAGEKTHRQVKEEQRADTFC